MQSTMTSSQLCIENIFDCIEWTIRSGVNLIMLCGQKNHQNMFIAGFSDGLGFIYFV